MHRSPEQANGSGAAKATALSDTSSTYREIELHLIRSDFLIGNVAALFNQASEQLKREGCLYVVGLRSRPLRPG
jgi:hypothetical protein